MTTFNPHIAAHQAAEAATVPKVSKPKTETGSQELPKQFRTARTQYATFNQEQVNAINAQLDLMERCYGKRITVNRLIKQATLEKAGHVLREDGEQHGS